MEDALKNLCDLLDDERERQENVLRVCQMQGDAARARDVAALDTSTDALDALIQEAVEAEQARLDAVEVLVRHFSLPIEQQTLTGLIAAAPAPWSSRLADFQMRIRALVEDIRAVTLRNNFVIRRSQQLIDLTLSSVSHQDLPSSKLYGATGTQDRTPIESINLLNEEG